MHTWNLYLRNLINQCYHDTFNKRKKKVLHGTDLGAKYNKQQTLRLWAHWKPRGLTAACGLAWAAGRTNGYKNPREGELGVSHQQAGRWVRKDVGKYSVRKLVPRRCWQLTGPDVGDGVAELEAKPTTAWQGSRAGPPVLLRREVFLWFLIQASYTRHYPTYNNNLFRSKQDA